MQEFQAEQEPGAQAEPGPVGAAAANTVTAAPASPVKPKWAALLEPAGPDAPGTAAGQAAAPFPGLGKTQAGNILASLASQPVASSSPSSPAPPAPPAPPGQPAAAPQKDSQPQASATAANVVPGGAGAGIGAGGTENGATETDPSKDDILPSKPRASVRLRPNFRLPNIQLPRFRLR